MFALSPKTLELMAYAILFIMSLQVVLVLVYLMFNMTRRRRSRRGTQNNTQSQTRPSRHVIQLKILREIRKLEQEMNLKNSESKSSIVESTTVNTFSENSDDTLEPVSDILKPIEDAEITERALVPFNRRQSSFVTRGPLLAITNGSETPEAYPSTRALALPEKHTNYLDNYAESSSESEQTNRYLQEYHSESTSQTEHSAGDESTSQIRQPITCVEKYHPECASQTELSSDYESSDKVTEITEYESSECTSSEISTHNDSQGTDFLEMYDPNVRLHYTAPCRDWKSTSSGEDMSRKFDYIQDADDCSPRFDSNENIPSRRPSRIPTKFNSNNNVIVKREPCIDRTGISKRPSFKCPSHNNRY